MSSGRATARTRIVGLTRLTRGKRTLPLYIIILTLQLEMRMISSLSFGGKIQTENAPLQNQNQRLRPQSPESLLLAMIVPILVLPRSKKEDVNLSAKLDQRTGWM